jgi:hypothetical protein
VQPGTKEGSDVVVLNVGCCDIKLFYMGRTFKILALALVFVRQRQSR